MANNCTTTYNIFGTHRVLSEIEGAVRTAIGIVDDNRKVFTDEKTGTKQDCYLLLEPYLSLVLQCLGIDRKTIEKRRLTENIRGYVCNMRKVTSGGKTIQLQLDCITAWNEADGFRHLLNNRYTGTEGFAVFYTAEEPGCGVYRTNDPDHADDVAVEAEDYGYCGTMKKCELQAFLEDLLEEKYSSLDEAVSYFSNADCVREIREYEYCED